MQPFTEIHHRSSPACPPDVVHESVLTRLTSGEGHSVLRPLKASILSLDWEISSAVMQRYDAELQRLESLWPKENIHLACLRILRALGKYITIHLAKTPQDAINLVSSVYTSLERIVSTPDMREADKVTIVQGELKKYNELKKQLASLQRPAQPQTAEPRPETATKVVPLDGPPPWRQSVIEDLFRQPQSTPADEQVAAQHLGVFNNTPPAARPTAATVNKEARKEPSTSTDMPIKEEDIAAKLNTFFDAETDDTGDFAGVVPLSRKDSEKPAAEGPAAGVPPATPHSDLLTSLFQEKPQSPANTLLTEMHLQMFNEKIPGKAAMKESPPPAKPGTAMPLDETAIRNKLDSFFDDEGTEGPDNSSGAVVRLVSGSVEREIPSFGLPHEESSVARAEDGTEGQPLPAAHPEHELALLQKRFANLAGICTTEPLPVLAREVLAQVAIVRNQSQLIAHAAHLEQLAATAGIAPLLSPALQDDARDIIEKLLRQIVQSLAKGGKEPDATDVRGLARAIARHAALVNDLLARQDRSAPPDTQPMESPDTGENDIMDLTAL